MRPSAIAFASVIGLGWAVAAAAGVVIKGQETATHAGPRPGVTSTLYTATIEGKQERIDLGGAFDFVIDLTAGKVLMLSGQKNAYYELPFPTPYTIGALIMKWAQLPVVKFKKTGKHLTLGGYGCDQYTGTRETADVTYSAEACYSTDPPGAQDYTAFVKSAAAKAGKFSLVAPDEIPNGIPVELSATIIPKQFETAPVQNPPAGSSQKPPTPQKPPELRLKTVITNVAARSIEAAEFQPPVGSKKVKPPRGLGVMLSR